MFCSVYGTLEGKGDSVLSSASQATSGLVQVLMFCFIFLFVFVAWKCSQREDQSESPVVFFAPVLVAEWATFTPPQPCFTEGCPCHYCRYSRRTFDHPLSPSSFITHSRHFPQTLSIMPTASAFPSQCPCSNKVLEVWNIGT